MKRRCNTRLGVSTVAFVVSAFACSACLDPGTAEDNSNQLTFTYLDPGYAVQLEFSDRDIQRFELDVVKQRVSESNQILTLRVFSGDRTDGQSNSSLYCFEDPVVLNAAENKTAPVTLIEAGGCMNRLNNKWVEPAILNAPNVVVDGISNQEWPGSVMVYFAENRTIGIAGPAAEGSRISYELADGCIPGEIRFELRETGKIIHTKSGWCLSDDGKFHINADELFAIN